MGKTIRDLFTKEEWELFSTRVCDQLQKIADLKLPEEMEQEVPADDGT